MKRKKIRKRFFVWDFLFDCFFLLLFWVLFFCLGRVFCLVVGFVFFFLMKTSLSGRVRRHTNSRRKKRLPFFGVCLFFPPPGSPAAPQISVVPCALFCPWLECGRITWHWLWQLETRTQGTGWAPQQGCQDLGGNGLGSPLALRLLKDGAELGHCWT